MSYIVPTLKVLALRGATRQFVSISTRRLGAELNISQQMASNRLIALSDAGLIIRKRGGSRGQDIFITREGAALLRKEYGDYRQIFEAVRDVRIQGTVSSGLGEGQYYLAQPEYLTQIEKKLGFRPFPGTLNITVAEDEYSKLDMVPQAAMLQIGGFEAGGRTFGKADCIPATIADTECAIIIPKRSHHTDVLEIISQGRLRKMLGLEDGDRVMVRIELQ